MISSEKKQEKTTESAVNTQFLSNRAIVQRFLLDNSGYYFSITQLRNRITEVYHIAMNHKTIRSAIKEINALGIGLEVMKGKAGRKQIPIHFYTIKKK